MNIKEQLCKPFKEDEHEWRVQSCGVGSNGDPWVMVLCYVQARPIQERLDEMFGVFGWKDEYRIENGGIVCRLSLWDREFQRWVEKENGAPVTEIEPFKGGISDAFKRVASSGYGIGRYLYNLDTTFANCSFTKEKNWKTAKTKDHKYIYWQVPQLPEWAFEGKPRPKGETRNENKTETKSKTPDKKKELINKIVDDLLHMADGEIEKAKLYLEKYTSFEGKDGNVVKGAKDTSELYNYSEKRLQVVHGKIKKDREEKDV